MEESEKQTDVGKKKRQKIGMYLSKIKNFKNEKEWSLWSIFRNIIYLNQFEIKFKEV
jgi:hypothetical protein